MINNRQWDVFTKFRAKLPAGRTDWRAFQLAFILYGGRRRKFGGPLWKEKKAIMLCHRFWVFPGCSTKTDSRKFELVPARTACFWRNIYGLTLEARHACRGQSKQRRSVSFHHPSADASLQKQWLVAIPLTNTPTLSKRTPMSAESTSSVEVDRVVIIGDDVPARFRCKKVHCFTVGELIFRDRYISTLSRTWTFHCRQWVERFIRKDAAIDGWQPVAPPCLCGHVQFWSRDWRT